MLRGVDSGNYTQELGSMFLLFFRFILVYKALYELALSCFSSCIFHWSPSHSLYFSHRLLLSLPASSDSKESACSAGDSGSIPGWERPSGEWNGNPLQYSCLENSTDRGAWRATVHRFTKSQTQLRD